VQGREDSLIGSNMWGRVLVLLLAICSCERLLEVNLQTPASTCKLGEVFVLRVPCDPFTGFLWFFRPLDGRYVNLLNGLTGTFVRAAQGGTGYQDFRLVCPEVGRIGSVVNVKLEQRALWREEALRHLTIPLTLSI